MKMKRILLATLLVFAMLCTVGLTACDDTEDTSSAASVGLAYEKSEDGSTCMVTGIGTCADANVIIPEKIDGATVTAIAKNAFENAASITGITFPSTLKTIGEYAFSGCTSLSSVILPDGVVNLGYHTFADCSSLTSVTIPVSVTAVRGGAFDGCSSLSAVYYEGADKTTFAKITVAEKNDAFKSATVYCYSEMQPVTNGNFWRYVDGVPTKW